MKLWSTKFKDGGKIPSKYTCDGYNILPPLKWEDAPLHTKSFILTIIDPDTPKKPFLHCFMYNIPGHVKELAYKKIPDKIKYLKNHFGNHKYEGPCPPPGKPHTYEFKLIALDTVLNTKNPKKIINIIKKHTLDQAIMKGTYKRKQKLVKSELNGEIPLEQQKAILMYAPKEKLWSILDVDNNWYNLLLGLPEPYRKDFSKMVTRLGKGTEQHLAKTYIKSKVHLQHLRETIVKYWDPESLLDSSDWLRKKGFLKRPLLPINLRANKNA